MLEVKRIYRNAAEEEIRVDTILMERRHHSELPNRRRIVGKMFITSVDMTVASIQLVGNFSNFDSNNFRWCEFEFLTDSIVSGVRQKKVIRCEMGDLPGAGDEVQ